MTGTGRVSGILLPLFSFRTRSDFGIGDFGSLERFYPWLRAARQKVLMLLPLLPTAPGDPSPYATRSAFGLNPLFLNLDAIPEFVESGGVNALSAEDRARLDRARASKRVDYLDVFPLKQAALERAFQRFEETQAKQNSARAQAFEQYRREQGQWLADFSLYAALSKEQLHKGWWDWPAPLAQRQPQALQEARTRLDREIRFHAWLQWLTEEQWHRVREKAREAGILLCGDEPFIVGQDSADAWAHPHLLRRDARLGVPPDDFSAEGQDWGLPYFDFAAMERDGFAWIKRRAQKATTYYDLRRIDHAVGYFRQWIRDAQAPKGRFIPPDEPSHRALGEKMFRTISEASGGGVIAEDLGVIPKFVREILAALKLPGYKVMRWERDLAVYRDPTKYSAVSLATTGTHDTETLHEWWIGATQAEREATIAAYPKMKGLPAKAELTPEIHRGLLASAESSSSDLCIVPWQDVLGTKDRVNLPGSTGLSNWSYRMDQTCEELLERDETKRAAELLATLTAEGGR